MGVTTPWGGVGGERGQGHGLRRGTHRGDTVGVGQEGECAVVGGIGTRVA